MENWWYPENFSESTTSKRPLWWIAPHPPVSGPCQQLTKSLQHWPSPELEQDAPCKLIQRKRRDIHGFQLVISIDFYVKCFKPPAAGQASRSRTRNEHLRNEALISVQYIHVCIYIYIYMYIYIYVYIYICACVQLCRSWEYHHSPSRSIVTFWQHKWKFYRPFWWRTNPYQKLLLSFEFSAINQCKKGGKEETFPVWVERRRGCITLFGPFLFNAAAKTESWRQ